MLRDVAFEIKCVHIAPILRNLTTELDCDVEC